MKKFSIFILAGAILASVLGLIGCATSPKFDSLPETHPNAAAFVGSWMAHDVFVSDGSLLSEKGQQLYYFYDDGTGEIIDFNKQGAAINRRVFRYRISNTSIGFYFLEGTIFTGGGSFTRTYSFSPDRRQIFFPYQKLSGLEGLIGGYFAEFSMATTSPVPEPPPTLVPDPVPIDNKGTVYYSYDGTGYVFIDNSVFYLCSNGKPVGYTEGGVIYGFNGAVLGFFEGAFIYAQNGYPKGAPDPKNLGVDAKDKKQVSKAGKQALPAKGAKAPANKPRLRNGYFGGTLADIFK